MDWLTERVLAAVSEVTDTLGGAAKWIESEFKNYSPRLEVSLQPFSVPKTQRTPRDLDLVNIVAVLPGTIDKDRYAIISGHYDSIAGYSLLIRDTPAPLWQREIYVGNVTEYTMPDTSIDDIVVGCAPSIRTEIQAWCRPMRWRPRG